MSLKTHCDLFARIDHFLRFFLGPTLLEHAQTTQAERNLVFSILFYKTCRQNVEDLDPNSAHGNHGSHCIFPAHWQMSRDPKRLIAVPFHIRWKRGIFSGSDPCCGETQTHQNRVSGEGIIDLQLGCFGNFGTRVSSCWFNTIS